MRRVVVTGTGAVSPVGNTAEEMWKSMIKGVNGIGPITKFDTEGFKVSLAAEVKDFNPLDYMKKSEASRQDLFSLYAIAAAEEAVNQSGILGNIDSRRFGVYVGSGTGGMNTFTEEMEKYLEKGPKKVSPFFVPKMIGNMAAGNIAIRYGCRGVNLPIVTACATSTHTIGEAFRAIKHGYADAIIAGGAEAAILPIAVAGFTNCQALSLSDDPDCASLPFDSRRAGFVMGEGAGMLVLEEYEHARKRGAHILAEICGYGNTCDAFHMTAPDSEGESSSEAIRQALEEAGFMKGEIRPEQVYFNAHGTGTQLNDRTETVAVKKAFGEEKAADIHVSSTKSMTGHMLGAAGAVEAIAAVRSITDNIVPPTINCIMQDEECDLNVVRGNALETEIKMSVSVSLGFGGHNGCIVFRETEDQNSI